MFANTVEGNAQRDITHRFVGVLLRDELCFCFQQSMIGRDSSIGIAIRYGLDGFGVRTLVGATFSAPVQTGLGFTHLSIPWAWELFPVTLTNPPPPN